MQRNSVISSILMQKQAETQDGKYFLPFLMCVRCGARRPRLKSISFRYQILLKLWHTAECDCICHFVYLYLYLTLRYPKSTRTTITWIVWKCLCLCEKQIGWILFLCHGEISLVCSSIIVLLDKVCWVLAIAEGYVKFKRC